LRQRKPTAPLDGLCLADGAAGPEASLLHRELFERFRQALAQLPGREAEVFCLRYFDDLSYQQIADALSLRVGAVAAALHKARVRLESLLMEAVQGE
jgi:RNA polymerase sigma-70 factor (ECF subfamily)